MLSLIGLCSLVQLFLSGCLPSQPISSESAYSRFVGVSFVLDVITGTE